ncbi:hypothetical protein ACFL6R_01280 [Gemmatimonadota bacterium]
MRDLFWKFFPILFGLVLGYLLFNPPVWFRELGFAGNLLFGGVVLFLFLGVVMAVTIPGSLPSDLQVTPAPNAADHEQMRVLAEELKGAGFTEIEPPMALGLRPPAVMIGLVNEPEQCYATIFRTGTAPAKIAFDCVSILEGDRGGLTSSAERGAGALVAGTGEFRQIFPKAAVSEVFRQHREAQNWLRERGLPSRRVEESMLVADLKYAIRHQRGTFLSNPVINGMITIVRAVTGRNPHLGPLAEQSIVESQLRRVIEGRIG